MMNKEVAQVGKLSEKRPVYLEKLAHLMGIESQYVDNWGRTVNTPSDTKRKLLEAMGLDATSESSAKKHYDDMLEKGQQGITSSVIVAEIDNLPATLSFRTPCKDERLEHNNLAVKLSVTSEEGQTDCLTYAGPEITFTGFIRTKHLLFAHWCLPFPKLETIGYYGFHLSVNHRDGSEQQDILVAICPEKAFMPHELQAGGKVAGVFFSLYSVRSEQNWGIGDFGDLKRLVYWVSSTLKGAFIGVNPLHATFNRSPFNTSPYLPISKFYRNFIYLDIPAIEDYRSSAAKRLIESQATQEVLKRLRSSEKVCYEEVAALKEKALQLVFERFLEKHWNRHGGKTNYGKDLEMYIAEEGDLLEQFATFCALDKMIHNRDARIWVWPQWPEQYQHPRTRAVERFRKEHWTEVLFYKYVQWQIEKQLAEVHHVAKEQRMVLGLYHDLALAVDRCGVDCWAYRNHFVLGASVGAPPDAFSQQGQDWGFPPPASAWVKQSGYRLFIEEIRKNCAFGGALRIDHVMRLFHLYLIPKGNPADQGAYVSQAWESLVLLLALESVRNRVVIIGEDLGTVPPHIRKSLEAAGVLSYRLLYFEKDDSGRFKKAGDYPHLALVTITTHDLPTLNGFWMGRDLEVRREAGLFEDDNAFREALKEREMEKEKLLDLVASSGFVAPGCVSHARETTELTGELHHALVGMLAMTPAKLFLLNQEDLFKEINQQNLPGTTDQYPNWTMKMKYTIEELMTNPVAIEYANMFRHWVEKSHRDILAGKES